MRERDHCPRPLAHNLHNVRQSLEQLLQLRVTVVRYPALPTEVVVVARDELVKRHPESNSGKEIENVNKRLERE